MEMEWLQKKLTIEEAEQNHVVSDKRLGAEPVPFGFMNDQWLDFRGQIQEGDVLWEFRNPIEFWEGLCGREGICIVREGEVIACIVTTIN
jgi:hypothetical protein